MNSYLYSNITSISVKDASNNAVTLILKDKAGDVVASLASSYAANSDYSVSAGKITIKAGVLATAENYTITVTATGYDTSTDATVTQTVAASTTAASSISGTFTLGTSTTEGATKYYAIPTLTNGDLLKYVICASSDNAQHKGNPLVGTAATTTPIALTTGDITGVNPTTHKYIDVYEVASDGSTIVGYKRITLAASNICAPTLATTATVNGTQLVLTSNTALSTSLIPVSTAFTVYDGTTADSVTSSGVAITNGGLTITLTLTTAVKSGDTVTIKYTKPSSGTAYLQDVNGNGVASITSTSTITITNSTTAAPTAGSSISINNTST